MASFTPEESVTATATGVTATMTTKTTMTTTSTLLHGNNNDNNNNNDDSIKNDDGDNANNSIEDDDDIDDEGSSNIDDDDDDDDEEEEDDGAAFVLDSDVHVEELRLKAEELEARTMTILSQEHAVSSHAFVLDSDGHVEELRLKAQEFEARNYTYNNNNNNNATPAIPQPQETTSSSAEKERVTIPKPIFVTDEKSGSTTYQTKKTMTTTKEGEEKTTPVLQPTESFDAAAVVPPGVGFLERNNPMQNHTALQQPGAIAVAGMNGTSTTSIVRRSILTADPTAAVDEYDDYNNDTVVQQETAAEYHPSNTSNDGTILVAANLVMEVDEDQQALMERLRELEERERQRDEQRPSVTIVATEENSGRGGNDDENDNNKVSRQEQERQSHLRMIQMICALVVVIGIIVGVTELTKSNNESPQESKPTAPPTTSLPTISPTSPPTTTPINRTQLILETVYDYSDSISNNHTSFSFLNDTNIWLALDWLSSEDDAIDTQHLDGISSNNNNNNNEQQDFFRDKLIERFALTKIHFDLQDDQNFWLVQQPDIDICQLVGITCDADGRVRELHGDGINHLRGTIPTEIGLLSRLESLNLSSNKLHGTIPSTIGQLLPNLLELSLWENSLTGEIPTEIGLLTNLEIFDMSLNKLYGPIPSEIGHLSNSLSLFIMDFNTLSGELPTELGLLTMMELLILDDNCLTGTFPSELSMLTNLFEVDLHNNRIEGHLEMASSCDMTPGGEWTDIFIVADCIKENVTCACCSTCCRDDHCQEWNQTHYVRIPDSAAVLPKCRESRRMR